MSNSYTDKIKKRFREEYGLELTTPEAQQYKNFQKNMSILNCGVVFGAIIVLFIVFGLLFHLLPWNQYTFIPLGIVICFLATDANQITKKIKQNDKKFKQHIFQQRQFSTTQTPKTPLISGTPPPTPSSYTIPTPKPKVTVFCPLCGEAIPIGADPCPKCGSPLVWE